MITGIFEGAEVTATELDPARLAEYADKAASIVDTNGHHKGYLYDEAQADDGTKPAECRVDAVGAVNTAVFGQPCWPAEAHPDRLYAEAVVVALEKTVGKPVPGWNDEGERTQDDVITNLWDTAERLRKEAA